VAAGVEEATAPIGKNKTILEAIKSFKNNKIKPKKATLHEKKNKENENMSKRLKVDEIANTIFQPEGVQSDQYRNKVRYEPEGEANLGSQANILPQEKRELEMSTWEKQKLGMSTWEKEQLEMSMREKEQLEMSTKEKQMLSLSMREKQELEMSTWEKERFEKLNSAKQEILMTEMISKDRQENSKNLSLGKQKLDSLNQEKQELEQKLNQEQKDLEQNQLEQNLLEQKELKQQEQVLERLEQKTSVGEDEMRVVGRKEVMPSNLWENVRSDIIKSSSEGMGAMLIRYHIIKHALIEFIDWRYSQSCLYFRPAF
jgi:hypothetical protein